MSMSQEEIESLMNGLDIAEDSASEVASEGVVPSDEPTEAPISEPVVETPEVEEQPAEETPVASAAVEETVSNDAVDELLASIESAAPVESNNDSEESIDDLINNLEQESVQTPVEDTTVSTDDIDELLASIDTTETTEEVSSNVDTSDIDELLAGIDGIDDSESFVEEVPAVAKDVPNAEAVHNAVEEKIQSGVFPLPADQESKVVTQLSAVANDSEEKATKIFDVLSYILDENAAIEGSLKEIETFLNEQEKVLETLHAKFPNVDVFSANLEMLQKLKGQPALVREKLNNENNELFSAMELMQYHDINRQKIERVMSVIRKLSVYLNNIFEDDNSHEEIVVAKHIAGDNTENLVDDADLDALIAEFGN